MCKLDKSCPVAGIGGVMKNYEYQYDDGFDRVMGEADAACTILAYESLTCPHCREFMEQVYPKLVANFVATAQARFVIREVFFDEAGLMAGIVLNAAPDDQYFNFLERLYHDQTRWLAGKDYTDIASNLMAYGALFGASEEKMLSDLQDQELAKALAMRSEMHMHKDEIKGAPTLIVNGVKAPNWSYEAVAALIQA